SPGGDHCPLAGIELAHVFDRDLRFVRQGFNGALVGGTVEPLGLWKSCVHGLQRTWGDESASSFFIELSIIGNISLTPAYASPTLLIERKEACMFIRYAPFRGRSVHHSAAKLVTPERMLQQHRQSGRQESLSLCC